MFVVHQAGHNGAQAAHTVRCRSTSASPEPSRQACGDPPISCSYVEREPAAWSMALQRALPGKPRVLSNR